MNRIMRGVSRTQVWSAVAVAITVCVGTAGCPDTSGRQPRIQESQGSPDSVAKNEGSGSPSPAASPFPTKLDPPVHDWKVPAAALLLTGEQHGYFEPCGCSLHQLGGMARRGDLVRILTQDRKWPLVGLDVGGLLKRNRRQDQIKFELLMNAFKHLKYAGVALGVEELRLGADFLLQQQVPDPEEAKNAVGLLGANIQLYDPPFPGWPLAFRVVRVGDVTVGVTAVLGASLRDQVAPAGAMANIKILDPAEVLPDVLAKLAAEKPDFLVLLSHGSEEEARELAVKFPQFQIVLTTGGPEEPDAKPVVVGKTWILQAGHKGKRVGVLGYYPDNADQPFRYELVALDDSRFKDDPFMRTAMQNFQQQIQDEGLATSEELLLKHPSGNTFTGAAKCGECHKQAYKHWKETKHAEGLESLKVGHPGQEKDWIVRTHDPECLSCHVTGWEPQQMLRYESGFFNEERSPHLAGQQCENCHGPGSTHVKLEEALVAKDPGLNRDDLMASRASVRRTVEEARRQLCIQCHDADNSPRFKPDAFDEFWSEIKHPWKD